MNAQAADVDAFERLAAKLALLEKARTGLPEKEVRKRISKRLGKQEGFLCDVYKSRVKGVHHWLMMKVRRVLLQELLKEKMRIEHDIQMLLQSGERPDSGDIQTLVGAAKNLLETLESMK